jgi:hypothetical protein
MRKAALGHSSEIKGIKVSEVEGALWIAEGNIYSIVVIFSRASCQIASSPVLYTSSDEKLLIS